MYILIFIFICIALLFKLSPQKGSALIRTLTEKFSGVLDALNRAGITNIPTNASANATDQVNSSDPRQLPDNIVKRIQEQRQGQHPWTSNLSTTDWLLLKNLGLKPLGLVTGNAHFQLGFSLNQLINQKVQYGYFSQSGEIEGCADVLREACHLALARLKEEAKLHGADAVVNVEIVPVFPRQHSRYIECQASGTAVTLQGSAPAADPLLSTTTLIEFAKLMQVGATPVGVSVGFGVYFNVSNYYSNFRSGAFLGNNEITQFSNATYHARNIAHRHMQSDIQQYDGSGVLTYNIDFSVDKIEVGSDNSQRFDHLLIYKCLGTVITETKQSAMPAMSLAINLN